MIDAHIHLEQYDRSHLQEAIEKWRLADVRAVIAVSNDLASSYRTLELQRRYPDFVHAAIGFHPEQPLPPEVDVLEWLEVIQTEQKHITAIGEVGLPHYNLDHLPHAIEQYKEYLSVFLDVADEVSLPVILHAVHDKASMVYKLLNEKQISQAHFHWLKAPEHVLEDIVQAGYYISVTPEVCYRKRDQRLAERVPLSRLLIETDGPWVFEQPFANCETTPLLLNHVIQTLADIKKISKKQLEKQIERNTRQCFQLTQSR